MIKDFIVKTDIGVVRSENQDRAALFKKDNAVVAILADGMGGHNGGSYASQTVIEVFEKEFNKNFPADKSGLDSWFKKTLKLTKKTMNQYGKKDPALFDMGTTLVMAILFDGEIKIYNIGDSRAYIYNGLWHQITKDHNLRNKYIEEHGYSEEKAATVVGAAALTSALGPKKRIIIDNFIIPIREDIKSLVLTSDGIHDYVSKPNFEMVVASEDSLEEKTDTLIKMAKRGKSSDNLTVVIVEVN